jgi:ribosome biogenesis GTPase A
VPPKSSKSAFGRLTELVKWVDLLIEVCDARAPLSSRHPNTNNIFGNKPRVVVLSKADLAEPEATKDWLAYFNDQEHQSVLALSFKNPGGKERLLSAVLKATADKREKMAGKGLLPRPVRICVVGMPNVGKSSLINWLIGKNRAKVADRPGVTRAPQWIRVHPQIELLDSPGVLPNRAFDEITSLKLALLNLLGENTYDQEEMARAALLRFDSNQLDQIANYFGVDEDISLESLAKKRNFITHGGKLDTRRAAGAFINDLREGKLGKVMLDSVP